MGSDDPDAAADRLLTAYPSVSEADVDRHRMQVSDGVQTMATDYGVEITDEDVAQIVTFALDHYREDVCPQVDDPGAHMAERVAGWSRTGTSFIVGMVGGEDPDSMARDIAEQLVGEKYRRHHERQ